MNQAFAYSRDVAQAREAAFMRRVYNWMLTGLALTGGLAWLTASSETMVNMILGRPMVFFALVIAELGMVFYLASRVHKLSASTASTLFIIYSLLNGLTLSFIFIAYVGTDIFQAFIVSAGMFGAMSIYGYTTQKSLASWGSFLLMGLFGVILASIVNIFMASSTLYWLVTYAGVIIFVGLTAYDTQRLKQMALEGFGSEEIEAKSAVMGALSLYLDFINLFLMMLRIFSGRD